MYGREYIYQMNIFLGPSTRPYKFVSALIEIFREEKSWLKPIPNSFEVDGYTASTIKSNHEEKLRKRTHE